MQGNFGTIYGHILLLTADIGIRQIGLLLESDVTVATNCHGCGMSSSALRNVSVNMRTQRARRTSRTISARLYSWRLARRGRYETLMSWFWHGHAGSHRITAMYRRRLHHLFENNLESTRMRWTKAKTSLEVESSTTLGEQALKCPPYPRQTSHNRPSLWAFPGLLPL